MQAAHGLKDPEGARVAVQLPTSLRNGLMAAGAILSAGIVIAMMYLLYRVIKPLKELGRAVYRMSHGQLDEPARVGDLKDIGMVGDMVNDMATDLQEMLLHVWNHTSQDIALLNRISTALGCDCAGNRLAPEIRKDFDFVRQDIQDMRAMVKAFDFYHVQIMNEKLVSKAHPQM
ncbi:MAG: HAMP domain-containing protein [Deltaproteobacteria bacterium]|nr:HAMP domain-containing protein [Deltaproteobacteria bacterium]